MLIHWIWLATRPKLSDRVKVALLQHFRDPEEIYFADNGAFDHIEGLTQENIEALQDKILIPAEEVLDAGFVIDEDSPEDIMNVFSEAENDDEA